MKIGLIIGTLIILAGLSVVLNAFHIHFPVFRAAVGLFLGWLGLSMVLASVGVDASWMAFRPHGVHLKPFEAKGTQEMSVVFAHNPIDLSGAKPGERTKVSVIFGDAIVRYDPNVPLELRTSTAFGTTTFADGNRIAFGDRVICTPACTANEPRAIVDVATVFGTTTLLPLPTPLAPPARPNEPALGNP